MKKLIALLIFTIVVKSFSYSQNWREKFYAPNEIKGGNTFFDMQKDFNEYWSKYEVKGGYYFVDGKKHKAAGWKQFKRWEWYWETRVNRETGMFPDINILKIQSEFLNNKQSKSDLSNWQSMGPDNSEGGYAGIGRINCIAFHPTNDNIFWIGAPSGGLWKTTDGGNSWEVLTDTIPVIGVSGIIIPNDYEISNTIYIATGDRDAGDNYSIGVLKSTNNGETWQTTGLSFNVSQQLRITRMLIHPTQQNIFYVATNGGIYKSTNSGTDWTEILDGKFYDMEFKYGCEDTVLYAASIYSSSVPKIFKTNDAGSNWTVVHTFSSNSYRVELDPSQSDSTIVYAMSCTGDGGLEGIYKSVNTGESFSKIYDGTISGNNLLNWYDGDSDIGGQGWYDLTLSVSPVDENHLFLGGINSWESSDGGINWNIVNHWYGEGGVPAVHADKHFMEFQNATTFFEANDGGIYKTIDGGNNWTDLTDGMIISQIYKLGVSQTVSDEVILGLQDNGSKLISSDTWYDVKGGDGMECIIDYTDANVQYATYVYGQIDRTTDHWSNWQTVVDISANIPGGPDGAWVTPYIIDPANNQTIYVGYSDVWKTTNRGNSWTKISSLSLNNKIRSMAIAPSDNNTLYITDFDNFYKTTNGGSNWINLTSNLPSTSNSLNYISVDAYDPTHLWITFGGYNNVKAYESFNGGTSWNNISNGLLSVPANTIIQNKFSKTQQLYVGTDMGVFFKDGDSDWELFSNNLPSVIVTELEIHYDLTTPENSILYASTYGRGLWKSNLSSFDMTEILTGTISGTYIVTSISGTSINIPYTEFSTFSSNTFTAYLSNANGDFTNETKIGESLSNNSGTINGTIPANTTSGNRYRIRVKSSSPVFTSVASNTFEIKLVYEIVQGTISSPYFVSETNSAQINIPFTINETFTSNTFTAYLSDANGSFASETEIGNLVSDIAGTIIGTIPANTASGTQYKVKIKSLNPIYESLESNAFEIILDNESPSVNITSTVSGTTSATPINITLTFNEEVTGFEQSDIVVVNGTISNFNTTNNIVYTAQVTPIAGGGITLDVPAGAATDFASNLNTEATQWSINYVPTGIEDMEFEGIHIFPIPAKNELNIEFENSVKNANIQIIDASGISMFSKDFVDVKTQKINLENYSNGIYIIKVTIEGQVNTTRFVVQ